MAADQLSFYGGAVEIADYCPFSQEFSWHLSGEYQRNSYCRVSENQPGSVHGTLMKHFGWISIYCPCVLLTFRSKMRLIVEAPFWFESLGLLSVWTVNIFCLVAHCPSFFFFVFWISVLQITRIKPTWSPKSAFFYSWSTSSQTSAQLKPANMEESWWKFMEQFKKTARIKCSFLFRRIYGCYKH